MRKTIELYFDVGSPTAYLAYKRLLWIEQTYNADLKLSPVLLGGIFQATGNQSPASIPLKAAWMDADLQRYADLYDVEFQYNPFFPINTLHLMRGAVAAQELGFLRSYLDIVYDAMWRSPENLSDLDILRRVLETGGIDADVLFEKSQDPTVKATLKQTTETAIERGVFGCPATFFNDELFFGQDRLFFIERKLSMMDE